jgi:hypothetical protein
MNSIAKVEKNLREAYIKQAELNYLKNYNSFLFHRLSYYLDNKKLTEDELYSNIYTFLSPNFSQEQLIETLNKLTSYQGKFIIIVPTRNRFESVKKLMQGLIRNSFQDWKVLLIDNGDDDTYIQIETLFPDKIIALPLNQYFGCAFLARNIGLDVLDLSNRHKKPLQRQFVIFIDSDDEISSDNSLENLNKLILESDEKTVMVNGYCEYTYKYSDGTEKKGTYPEYFTDGKPSVNNLTEFFPKGPNILSAATDINYVVSQRYPEEFSFEDNGFNHKLIYRINKSGDKIVAGTFPVTKKYWGFGSIACENDNTGVVTDTADLCGIKVKGLRSLIVNYLKTMTTFFMDNGL